jgi:hypothetical protein
MAALASSSGGIIAGGGEVDVDEPRLVQALKTGNLKAVDDIIAGSASLTINSLLSNQVRYSTFPIFLLRENGNAHSKRNRTDFFF